MRHFAVVLIVFLLVAMGPPGIEGLSQITGLQIVAGTYEFQGDITIIRATGTHPKTGMEWQVLGIWQHGLPVKIITHSPRNWGS